MEPRSGCPINAAVEVLGDRWSLLVLRDVIFGDRRYFRALLTGSVEGIASNILADRLVRLVEAGILTRGTAARGQRARYSLTESGIQTLPVLTPSAPGVWTGAPAAPSSAAGSSSCATRARRSSRSSWTSSASCTSTPRRRPATVRARSSASPPPTPSGPREPCRHRPTGARSPDLTKRTFPAYRTTFRLATLPRAPTAGALLPEKRRTHDLCTTAPSRAGRRGRRGRVRPGPTSSSRSAASPSRRSRSPPSGTRWPTRRTPAASTVPRLRLPGVHRPGAVHARVRRDRPGGPGRPPRPALPAEEDDDTRRCRELIRGARPAGLTVGR